MKTYKITFSPKPTNRNRTDDVHILHGEITFEVGPDVRPEPDPKEIGRWTVSQLRLSEFVDWVVTEVGVWQCADGHMFAYEPPPAWPPWCARAGCHAGNFVWIIRDKVTAEGLGLAVKIHHGKLAAAVAALRPTGVYS